MMNRTLVKHTILISLLSSPLAFAQADDSERNYVPEDIEKKSAQVNGWDKYLGIGLYGTINENSNVVGKDDGQSTTLGFKLAGALDLKEGQSEWLNSLDLLVAYSRTPLIPQYLKSDDSLALESLYKYYLESTPWFGAFAQVNLDTAIFAGYDTQGEEVDYRRVTLDGNPTDFRSDREKLTDGFKPFRLRESFGALATPLKSDPVTIDFKLGIGLRQVFADGQFIASDFQDDNGSGRLLTEIESFEKAGYEVGTEIKGSLQEKRVKYSLKANVLFPVYDSLEEDGDDQSTFDKRVIDVSGKASFQLVEWASIDYLLTVTRDPGITDKSQVSQSMLFSLNKVLAERQKKAE